MHELKNAFRPEFLNRIDEIIVFKSLTEDEIVQIVDLMVAELRERMIAQNMTINLDDAAKEYGMAGNYVAGANIAGFEKIASAMMSQGVV